MRKSFVFATMIGLVCVAFLVIGSKRQGMDSTTAPANPPTEQADVTVSKSLAGNTNSGISVNQEPAAISFHSETQPSEKARQLVKSLGEIDGELTVEKADKWKRNLEELIEEGKAAAPVLAEFFQSNLNVKFDSGGGTNLLESPTLRVAFIKVLFDIPTPDNVDLQEQVLRSTTDPEEVALLAHQLELQEPGVYRGVIIKAIKSSVIKAKNGEYPGSDVTPLFEILAQYGIRDIQ